MPKRKSNLSKDTLKAKKMKMNRKLETYEKRKLRLEARRRNQRNIIANETVANREIRLQSCRVYDRERRANETVENREIRLKTKRMKANDTRAQETPEQHESRIAVIRDRAFTTRRALWKDLKSEAFNYKKEYDYRLEHSIYE